MRRLLLLVATVAMALFVASPMALAQTDDLDCADFTSQADAQAELRADPTDPNGLDAEDDGVACETFAYPEDTPRDEVPVEPAQSPTGDFDCEDFENQEEAQAVYDEDTSDPNGLDADEDGEACEDFNYGDAPVEPDGETMMNGDGMVDDDENGAVQYDQYGDSDVVEDDGEEDVIQDTITDTELPDTGGASLLLPAGMLLSAGGLLGMRILRRRV